MKAGLPDIRFHHGGHTAVTILPETGVADWVIQARVEHVDPQMMKHLVTSGEKLDAASVALEPSSIAAPSTSCQVKTV